MRAILTYHSIDDTGSPISVSPAEFEAHLHWLTSSDVAVLSVDELLQDRSGPPAVAITFDDALESAGRWALPQLADRGLPVTIFVPSQHVGGDNRWSGVTTRGIPVLPVMSWHDLGGWMERGVAIGAHTRTHPRLPDCPSERQVAEIAGCREEIRRELGVQATGFAYPYGALDDGVRALAAHHYAWSVGTTLRPLGDDDHPHALPRLDAWYFRDVRRFRAWGSAALRRWLTLRRLGRTVRETIA